MESQKIINLLDHKDEDNPRFKTRKWYIVNDHNNGNYSQGDDLQSFVKFDTEIVRPFSCDYSDAYILVTDNIKVKNGNDATRVAIKNCRPFTRASFKLNNEQVDTADNLDLTMNLYNMLEYSDNYADTTASLYQYKRPEPKDNNDNVVNFGTALSSFKYQSGLVQKQLTTPNSENVPANTDPNFANAYRIYVTQKEFKNVTKVDTSDFALKTNVAEIKNKVDDIEIDKINGIDKLQGKNYIEDSYLYLNQKYKYFNYGKTDTQKLLPWQSAGISNEKLTPIKDTNSASLLLEKAKPYLKISYLKFLAQGKMYIHKSLVNIYIVYLMSDITDVKGSDLLKYGLFGATGYDTNNKLVGYGVGFGTQKYTHDDSKEARKLVIIGTNSNALVLGKGSIKITINDSVSVQAKDKLKKN